MADAGDGAKPVARRRVAGRWTIGLAGVLLLAGATIAAIPWILSDPGRMSRLVATTMPELDGDVTFRSVRVGWLGPVVLEGIGIAPRDGRAAPLRIARVEAEHGLAAMVRSWGDVGRVRVEGLEADVVFDADRRSNLTGLVRSVAERAADRDGVATRSSRVRLRLEVDDAVVRIAGPWSATTWQSDPIDIRATLGPAADGTGSEWAIEPVQLLTDARLEPGVAQGVLAYIAPILANATRTSGRFSLRLDGARVPVGRPADGVLSGVLAMHEVVVGPGPLVENLLASFPARLPAPPDVRIADESHVAFRLADRRVTHEGLGFGLPLARAGQRLDVRSSGSVGIDDGALDLRLRLPVPADLPRDKPVLAALAGKSISVGIAGVLGQPRVVFDGSIREAAGDFVGDLVNELRGDQAVPGEAAAIDGATDAIADIVGGILEEVARRRAERRALEEASPDAVPPRRRDRGRGRVREPDLPR